MRLNGVPLIARVIVAPSSLLPRSSSIMAAPAPPPLPSSSSDHPRPGKKQRTVFTSSPYGEVFKQYCDRLNFVNEKRERLVKASRDVTMYSKKVIFQIHRLNKENKKEVLEQAEKDLGAVRTNHVKRIAIELQDAEFWKFKRAYTPGMQEYTEAATFLEYCKSGKLLTLDGINESLAELKDALGNPFTINLQDYLLGVGDLTGELMRLAISHVMDGEPDLAKEICGFVRILYGNLVRFAHNIDDNSEMNKKMDTMLQSLMKVESTCYAVHVRGSEYFPGSTFDSIDVDAS